MSSENVELVRQGYIDVNAFMRGDLSSRALVTLLDPQIEWDWELEAARPPDTPKRVRGAAELIAFLEQVRATWPDVVAEPLEFTDGADGRVLVFARQARRGTGQADPEAFHVFHLWTIRDKKVCRLEIFLERTQALEAAGLRK